MHHDLCSALAQLRNGSTTASALMELSLAAARSEAARRVFVRDFFSQAEATASATDALLHAGAPQQRLAGLAISVKDLFDVAGQPTSAASASRHDAAAAREDATAVARLRRAGAALIGHTNMSEFAFSGLGLNPHHGTPVNPACLAIDGSTRIPGGSTSGGAVSVAIGAAWAALGSDTGGSIRIPAALNGLVGFKNTARLTPSAGCIPLSPSLDTVCAITRSARDAVLLHEVLSDQEVSLAPRPLTSTRLGVPAQLTEGMDPVVARAFERSVAALRDAGACIEAIDLPIENMAGLQAQGGFAAAESWAWHRTALKDRETLYDPRVALRIRRGASISAADYIDLQAARKAWIARMEHAMQGYDALLCPTVPTVPPEIAPLLDSDDAFFASNALMLRNTSVINLLDGCSISLPCQSPDELPVGLMLSCSAMKDELLLALALQVERVLAPITRRGEH
ncbi:amidase [Roseateles sp.]|jgi:amidase/aspartyl-tRNA(Asn)/glutamyl-tRNA(Gln) amidotransferase subunit A|uniref:amidase n=1 Tax=Roseateles sp. TaxID=1971397 RepID=UPI0037C59CC1